MYRKSSTRTVQRVVWEVVPTRPDGEKQTEGIPSLVNKCLKLYDTQSYFYYITTHKTQQLPIYSSEGLTL